MANICDLVPKAGVFTNPGVVVDTEPLTVSQYHRYTNTTGLTLPEKQKFNEILDAIYKKEDDVEKINDIQTSIDGLKMDPANSKIVQYLRNMQAHLVRSARTLPRTYNLDDVRIKD